jgi:hypothetical protein
MIRDLSTIEKIFLFYNSTLRVLLPGHVEDAIEQQAVVGMPSSFNAPHQEN